jgi:hypothetical protein
MNTNHHQSTTRQRPRFVAWIALALIVGTGFSCETTKPRKVQGMREVRGQTFSILVPQHYEMQTPQVSGFNQFVLFEPMPDGSRPLTLNIYEGFDPQRFFSTRKDRIEQHGLVRESVGSIRIGPFQGNEARGRDKNGNYWRELYLRQPDQIASLHIWYFEASKEKSAEFDAVLGSLAIRLRR